MTDPTDPLVEKVARAICPVWHYAPLDSPDGRARWEARQSQCRAEAKAAIAVTADEIERLQAQERLLIADLAKFDAEISCEGCGAPLFDGDDFVTGPEDGCSGCWAAMTDLPSKRERPCYAYRVGKPSAAQSLLAKLEQDAK